VKRIINFIIIIFIKFKESFYFIIEYLMLLINNVAFGIIQFSILKVISNYSDIMNNKIVSYVLSVIIIKEVTFSDVYKGIENDFHQGKILFVLTKPLSI